MKFNINDYVKVKLTEHGKKILKEKDINNSVDENGYTKFQLWDIMNIFGEYCILGCDVPFETEIIIPEDTNL